METEDLSEDASLFPRAQEPVGVEPSPPATSPAAPMEPQPQGDPAPVLLSHARLTMYSSCPEKFRLSYIEEFPSEPQGPLIGGSAVHETIEWCETQGDPFHPGAFDDSGAAVSRFHGFLEQHVDEAGGDTKVRWSKRGKGEDLTWWKTFGAGMLRNYHEQRIRDVFLGWEVIPELTEAAITAELGEAHNIVRGITDAVYNTPDGVTVRDYKTGNVRSDGMLQLTLYRLLLAEHFDLDVNIGQLAYLRTNKWIDYPKLHPYEEAALIWIDQIADAIRGKVFFMVPGVFCPTCPVRVHCDWGKTLEVDDG